MCASCLRTICSNHWYAVPVVKETLLVLSFSGQGRPSRRADPQAAWTWMTSGQGTQKDWQQYRFFCGVACAASFLASTTPNQISAPNGTFAILTFSDPGRAVNSADFSIGPPLAPEVWALVEWNLPPELRPTFQARVTGSDVRTEELDRAKRLWESGEFGLAADIYERWGYPQFAAQARELARTSRVVQTSVTIDYNRLVEQLKDLRKPIAYSCPQCGAGMLLNPATSREQLEKCSYCGATFTLPDIMGVVQRMVERGAVGQGTAAPGSPTA